MKYISKNTGEVFEDLESAREKYCAENGKKKLSCYDCPISLVNNGHNLRCDIFCKERPEEAANLMGVEPARCDTCKYGSQYPTANCEGCGSFNNWEPKEADKDINVPGKKAHWIDNGDSYICSCCGHEVNNPNKQLCGAGKCSMCGAKMEHKEVQMGKQNKPPCEWTLREAKEYCEVFRERVPSGKVCEQEPGCVLRERGICKIENKWPHLWDVSRLTEREANIMKAVGAKWVSLSRNAKNERVILWRDKPEKSKNGMFYGAISIAYVSTDLFPSVKPGDCVRLED